MNALNTRTEHFGVFSGVFRGDPPDTRVFEGEIGPISDGNEDWGEL
jgi:hypothetical protein